MDSSATTQSEQATGEIVRFPLAPDTLTRLKKLSDFPAEPFDAEGLWSRLYRYDACRGRTKQQWNPAIGWLRLTRSVDAGESTLQIEDHFQFQGSQQHRKASVHYKLHSIARPVDWNYEVSYLDESGRERKELRIEQQGVLDGSSIVLTTNGKRFSWKAVEDLACGWGLLDAVQRLPLDPSVVHRFSLFDGLQTVKSGHRLSYVGESSQPWGDRFVKLHQFRQFGAGIGPTEYWLNENHQLVLITSMTLACIVDPAAIQKAAHDVPLVVNYEL